MLHMLKTVFFCLKIFGKHLQSVEGTEIGLKLYNWIAFFCKVHIACGNLRNTSCLSVWQWTCMFLIFLIETSRIMYGFIGLPSSWALSLQVVLLVGFRGRHFIFDFIWGVDQIMYRCWLAQSAALPGNFGGPSCPGNHLWTASSWSCVLRAPLLTKLLCSLLGLKLWPFDDNPILW
jgi:hypothetical protein